MNKIFLIIRPRHDETTHYLFHWARRVIQLAKKKGIQVLDLKEERANKEELSSIISKKQPSFIFFNGHGDSDCIRGHDDKILVKAGENEGLLKSKIVYALSCKSGKKLGPKSIETGAFTYMGYDEDFIFIYDQGKVSRPLSDNMANLFLKPSNQLVISLLKGHTAGESYIRSRASFMANIQKLLSSESPFSFTIPYLFWDMRHQVCLGDRESRF